jgi:D-proline reductase (dithiol) PrdB
MSETIAQLTESIRTQWDPQFEPLQTEFIPWAPWHTPVGSAKVVLISTGGVYLRNGMHQLFDTENPYGDPSFREFPSVVAEEDLGVAHVQAGASYARQDINVVFPLGRLKELADEGYVGSVAPFAYSFMGHVTRPARLLANYAPSVAYRIKRMGADIALVVAAGLLDHQTAGLVARAIELAGIPTIVLGTSRELLEAVKAPRSVVVKHPAGATLGNPGNAGKHQYLLREMFDAAWEFESAGLVAELGFSWSGQ